MVWRKDNTDWPKEPKPEASEKRWWAPSRGQVGHPQRSAGEKYGCASRTDLPPGSGLKVPGNPCLPAVSSYLYPSGRGWFSPPTPFLIAVPGRLQVTTASLSPASPGAEVLRRSSWGQVSVVGHYGASFSVSFNRWTILIHSKLLSCKIKFLRTVVRTRFMQTDLTHSPGVCTQTAKLSPLFSSKGALFVCCDRTDTTRLMNSHVVFCFLFTEECTVPADLPHYSNLRIRIISFLTSTSVVLLLSILVLHKQGFIWIYYETKGYKRIPQIKWKNIQITIIHWFWKPRSRYLQFTFCSICFCSTLYKYFIC